MIRSRIGAALVALLAMALAGCGGGQSGGGQSALDVGVTKDTILLGGTFPLSGSAAAYGTIARAEDAYFRYVNEKGGVNGRKIQFKYLDDSYNPAQTVPLTRQLVEQDQVFLLFSGLGTQAQTSVREYLNTKKVPQVFVATGATTFSAEFKKYPYTFGWQPTYQGESLIYARHVLEKMPTAKVGVIYQNDDYGQDYLNGLVKGLGSKAGMIVEKQSNEVQAPDLVSQIAKLKESGADTLFIFETPSPAIKALATVAKLGWHPQIFLNTVAAPLPYVQTAAKAIGDPRSVEGILTVVYTKDAIDPRLATDSGVQLYKQVMASYYPDGKIEDSFNVFGMATAHSMVEVLKKAGANPTRKSVLEALNSLNDSSNPFVLPGVQVKNTSSDHYTITQEVLARYSAQVGDYQQVGDLIDVRGKIKFP